jgi:D-serine deaminase-like pyridoxal phosphate-dependent protein
MAPIRVEPLSAIDRTLLAPTLPAGLDTPCVVVDLDVFESNVTKMQALMRQRGIALRPHLKTAKSVEVAKAVIDAGAVGITVATLGEASVFADAGIDDIFVAYPLLAIGAKATRLRSLSERCKLRIGADSIEGLRALSDALGDRRLDVGVVLEVDSGERRSGVAPQSVGILRDGATKLGLRVDGAFTHGGHGYAGQAAAVAAGADEVDALSVASDQLGPSVTLSAGSTPTVRHSSVPPVNEQRPGTYMFGDRHQAAIGSVAAGEHAVVVAATVVSRTQPGWCVIDAGAKALAKDRAGYVSGHGVIPSLPGAVITTVYDHHAMVWLGDEAAPPAIGDVVAVIPNHVCPVVNLTDRLHVIRNGQRVDVWAVATRGMM